MSLAENEERNKVTAETKLCLHLQSWCFKGPCELPSGLPCYSQNRTNGQLLCSWHLKFHLGSCKEKSALGYILPVLGLGLELCAKSNQPVLTGFAGQLKLWDWSLS